MGFFGSKGQDFLDGCKQAANFRYDIEEDFEAVGYELGLDGTNPTWSESGSGTINPNYTTVVLSGSQSYLIDDYDEAKACLPTLTLATACSPFDMYFMCQTTDHSPGDEYMLYLEEVGDSNMVRLRVKGGGKTLHADVTDTETSSGVDIALSTTYHIWVHYVKGTGANAVLDVYISTTADKPSSAQIAISDGDSTGDISFLTWRAQDMEWIFDGIKINTDGTAIGSNP